MNNFKKFLLDSARGVITILLGSPVLVVSVFLLTLLAKVIWIVGKFAWGLI